MRIHAHVRQRGIVDRLAHRTCAKRARLQLHETLAGDVDVLLVDVAAVGITLVHRGGNQRRADPDVWIEHRITGIAHGEHEALDQLHRELARVDRLLDVVALDVGNLPHVARVLAEWVAGELAHAWPPEVALLGILGRHPDRVEVPLVGGGLGPPVEGLVPAREPLGAVKPMPEVPDDAVAELESELAEDRKQHSVQRSDLSVLDVVSHLPAERALRL